MSRSVLANLLLNTASYDSATWAEIDIVQDVNVAKKKETFDTSKRRGKGIRTKRMTMLEIIVTGKMQVADGVATGNPDWDQFKYFSDAWDADGILDLMLIDGPLTTNGSKGFRGFFQLSTFDEDQSIANEIWNDFQLDVSDPPFATLTSFPTAKPLRKVRIAGGVPTYAPIGSSNYS